MKWQETPKHSRRDRCPVPTGRDALFDCHAKIWKHACIHAVTYRDRTLPSLLPFFTLHTRLCTNTIRQIEMSWLFCSRSDVSLFQTKGTQYGVESKSDQEQKGRRESKHAQRPPSDPHPFLMPIRLTLPPQSLTESPLLTTQHGNQCIYSPRTLPPLFPAQEES